MAYGGSQARDRIRATAAGLHHSHSNARSEPRQMQTETLVPSSDLPFCFFLELHLQHMEVPRLGVKSELELPAYTTATATWNPSRVCDLHHSSQQHWILNPRSGARDQTCILMDPSQIRFCCATMGTPIF